MWLQLLMLLKYTVVVIERTINREACVSYLQQCGSDRNKNCLIFEWEVVCMCVRHNLNKLQFSHLWKTASETIIVCTMMETRSLADTFKPNRLPCSSPFLKPLHTHCYARLLSTFKVSYRSKIIDCFCNSFLTRSFKKCGAD